MRKCFKEQYQTADKVVCEWFNLVRDIINIEEKGPRIPKKHELSYSYFSILKGGKCVDRKLGRKAGSNELRSSIIGRSKKCHCLQRINCRPVNYMASKRSYMPGIIFTSWLIGEENNIMDKVLINGHGHPELKWITRNVVKRSFWNSWNSRCHTNYNYKLLFAKVPRSCLQKTTKIYQEWFGSSQRALGILTLNNASIFLKMVIECKCFLRNTFGYGRRAHPLRF